MDVICTKCGSVNDYTTRQNGPHTTAYCNTCTAYIKNIPSAKPTFYVGKFKGTAIEEVNDLGYLIWANDNMTSLNARQKEACVDRIRSLSEMLK